ncbi:hypothetical protein EO98_18940 [Methanosarcina sp. 2.H.T.1A.6]|uniref:hypothetical protein n=1 Tax=unclassified Methanosarcina TaxID=2644672 RepID=UPI000621EC6C|nr:MULTISPECIES: hypothetical protein [unclassified Methanosarcina]KKG16578.1 hypothetical protein EO94_07405 [Methanosarcina sp. 2.H.T.1A.3]KKG19346.1 hypothetical protein EO98_18940 [Methanosarcina sp. 2.H.T.1A.6]KKG20169.1 hypothetical protein EO97_09555 [Methanosarcina sp. 2.H.T.1A.15]KKG25612.1 hypothetical protein EO96_18905 [Methanosarcina sp. 2.H.T.1A.8]
MKDEIFLLDLISHRRLKKTSGTYKKLYKYAICGIFINIIYGKHYTDMQCDNIRFLISFLKSPPKKTDVDLVFKIISTNVNSSLENSHFKKPYDNIFLGNVITFLRCRLKEIDNNEISLFQIKEISQIFDVNKYYGISCLTDHHWVQFSLDQPITVTFPEYILFNDLKVQWNYYLDVRTNLSNSQTDIKDMQDKYEYLKDNQNRHDSYSLGALHRTLIILCVSFVEAYLYDLLLSITENLSYNENINLDMNKRKIQDKEIVDRVLFKLFPNIKNDAKIGELFTKYKEVINIRDRYIHASAFIDPSSKESELKPLLKLNEKSLVESLQLSVDFVKKINELLPEELKILYWMDSNKTDENYNTAINFNNFSKLTLINSKSHFNQRDYYNP